MAGPGGDREPLGEDELVEMKDEVDDAMLSRMLVKDILGVRMEGSDIWPEAGLQVCVCVHVCARMRERERECVCVEASPLNSSDQRGCRCYFRRR